VPVTALIIGLSAAAAAATGFGFNLISTPLLTLFYPPRFVVTLTLLLGVFASGLLLLRPEIKNALDWRIVRPLFLSSLAGMPFGVMFLLWGQPRALKVLIAALTSIFALIMLTRFRLRATGNRYEAIAVGAFSGFLSTSTSLNGPPVAFYLLGRSLSKHAFRGNMVLFVFLATLVSLVMLAAGGTVSGPILAMTLKLLPVLGAGFLLGFLVANRLSERSFEVMILGFLVIVGALGVGSTLR
jgi:uncharacterized membrane protein YfcA